MLRKSKFTVTVVSGLGFGLAQAAIDGSGGLAIDASGALAIDASGARAIDASGALAIDASGARAIDASGSASSVLVNGGQLVAHGPVDRIHQELSSIEVLGQTIAFTGGVPNDFSPGTMVSVFGRVLGDGFISGSAVISTGEQYVPGATPVFVSGYVSESQSHVGRVQIGSLEIDHNAAANVSSDLYDHCCTKSPDDPQTALGRNFIRGRRCGCQLGVSTTACP